MVAYRISQFVSPGTDGVNDQSARLPSAIDGALLIVAVYLFLRAFRRGSEVDGGLIVAASAGIIGYSRAAATDMPLAAMFSMALLGWLGWYRQRSKLSLFAFYGFLALATLAKGPVAPFLAAVILLLFSAVQRDWLCLRDMLWIPGIVSYCIIALPWYVAVQMRNPQFFRFFILEHNLARFSEDLYHHTQPFWFYLPVFLLAIAPWTIWLLLAIGEQVRAVLVDRNEALPKNENALDVFLLIWLIVPVLFFSASHSKLPGYILPAVPAGGLLVTQYVTRRRSAQKQVPWWMALTHAILCGALVFAAFVSASFVWNGRLSFGNALYVSGAIGMIAAILIAVSLRSQISYRIVRDVTLAAVVVSVAAVLRLAGPVLDLKMSARPIASVIQTFSRESIPIAVFGTNREQEYGLEFYLNASAQHYAAGQVPAAAHVLVASRNTKAQFGPLVAGRKILYLTSIPAQNLELYYVTTASP